MLLYVAGLLLTCMLSLHPRAHSSRLCVYMGSRFCMCITVRWGHGRNGTFAGGSCSPDGDSSPCSVPDLGRGLDHTSAAPGRPESAWPDWSDSPCGPTPGHRQSSPDPPSRPLRSEPRPPAARWCRDRGRLTAPGRGSQTSWRWTGPLVRQTAALEHQELLSPLTRWLFKLVKRCPEVLTHLPHQIRSCIWS